MAELNKVFPFVTDAVQSYNQYKFDASTQTLSVQHRPEYDEARRTVVATIHSFTLKTMIAAIDPTNADPKQSKTDTSTIRQRLLVPGGQLVYSLAGIGSFSVNSVLGVGAFDARWGPIPSEIGWEPIGNGGAGWLTWKVQVCVPEQCANPAYKGALMAWNYDYTHNKDASGYSRRSISGYVEIPMTRNKAGDRTVPDCIDADKYRSLIYPPVPVGFRRTTDDWKVSKDRRRGDFTFVDEEMPPNAPPAGAIFVDAAHSVESDGPGFFRWSGTISASYELSRLKSRADAWKMFGDLLKGRLDAAKSVLDRIAKGTAIIPVKLSLSEPEIYGKKCGAFSCNYFYTLPVGKGDNQKLLNVQALKDAVTATALWDPLGTGFKSWAKSMTENKVYDSRGVAGLTLDPASDTIIDLCLPQNPPKINANANLVRVDAFSADRNGGVGLDLPFPTAHGSWLDYDLKVSVEPVNDVVELKPLPMTPIQYSPFAGDVDDANGYTVPYGNVPTTLVQYRAAPSVYVTLEGHAMRAGYQITPPALVSLGGAKAVPQNARGYGFRTGIVANYGIPVVGMTWRLLYLLTSMPQGGIGAPDNPLMGTIVKGPAPVLKGFVTRR